MSEKNLQDMTLAELIEELKVSYGWREKLIIALKQK